jgi:hypothetical protein
MNLLFKIIQHLPETDQIVVKFCRQNSPKPIDEYDAVAIDKKNINFSTPETFGASLILAGMSSIERQLREEPILQQNSCCEHPTSTNIDDHINCVIAVNYDEKVVPRRNGMNIQPNFDTQFFNGEFFNDEFLKIDLEL